MAAGAENVRNSKSNTPNKSSRARMSTDQEIMERFLLLLILATVLDAYRRRQMEIANGFLYRGHSAAKASAHKTSRDLYKSLQVLPADFCFAGLCSHGS